MVVTSLPSFTVVKFLQLLNALAPTVLTFSPMVTVFTTLLFLNAPPAIAVTLYAVPLIVTVAGTTTFSSFAFVTIYSTSFVLPLSFVTL